MYAIFDSMDRRCSRNADMPSDLFDQLEKLAAEAEEEGSRLTYAIAAILPDGTVTFD